MSLGIFQRLFFNYYCSFHYAIYLRLFLEISSAINSGICPKIQILLFRSSLRRLFLKEFLQDLDASRIHPEFFPKITTQTTSEIPGCYFQQSPKCSRILSSASSIDFTRTSLRLKHLQKFHIQQFHWLHLQDPHLSKYLSSKSSKKHTLLEQENLSK